MSKTGVKSKDEIDTAKKYGKRPRHKPKPYKYEYKGETTSKTPSRGLQPTRRKRKLKDALLKEDFRAANVDSERVTLRSKHTHDLFSKSKSSFPISGRDLPDLTFTNMDFLSRPKKKNERDYHGSRIEQSRGIDGQSTWSEMTRTHFDTPHPVTTAGKRRKNDQSQSYPRESRREVLRVRSSVETHTDSLRIPNKDTRPCKDTKRTVHSSGLKAEKYAETKQVQDSKASWSTSPPQPTRLTSRSAAYNDSDEEIRASSRHFQQLPILNALRLSRSMEAGSSISNHLFNIFTDRLLHRKQQLEHASMNNNECAPYQSLDDLKRISHQLLSNTLPSRILSQSHEHEDSLKHAHARIGVDNPFGTGAFGSTSDAHGPQCYLDDHESLQQEDHDVAQSDHQYYDPVALHSILEHSSAHQSSTNSVDVAVHEESRHRYHNVDNMLPTTASKSDKKRNILEWPHHFVQPPYDVFRQASLRAPAVAYLEHVQSIQENAGSTDNNYSQKAEHRTWKPSSRMHDATFGNTSPHSDGLDPFDLELLRSTQNQTPGQPFPSMENVYSPDHKDMNLFHAPGVATRLRLKSPVHLMKHTQVNAQVQYEDVAWQPCELTPQVFRSSELLKRAEERFNPFRHPQMLH